MRAALIYQHATDDADRRLADRLSDLVEEQRGSRRDDSGDGDDGPVGALVPVG